MTFNAESRIKDKGLSTRFCKFLGSATAVVYTNHLLYIKDVKAFCESLVASSKF